MNRIHVHTLLPALLLTLFATHDPGVLHEPSDLHQPSEATDDEHRQHRVAVFGKKLVDQPTDGLDCTTTTTWSIYWNYYSSRSERDAIIQDLERRVRADLGGGTVSLKTVTGDHLALAELTQRCGTIGDSRSVLMNRMFIGAGDTPRAAREQALTEARLFEYNAVSGPTVIREM